LEITSVLVVIPNGRSTLVEILDFLGNSWSFLLHSTTNGAPYPLAVHVNTPLNGAAALVLVGWEMITGAGSVYV